MIDKHGNEWSRWSSEYCINVPGWTMQVYLLGPNPEIWRWRITEKSILSGTASSFDDAADAVLRIAREVGLDVKGPT